MTPIHPNMPITDQLKTLWEVELPKLLERKTGETYLRMQYSIVDLLNATKEKRDELASWARSAVTVYGIMTMFPDIPDESLNPFGEEVFHSCQRQEDMESLKRQAAELIEKIAKAHFSPASKPELNLEKELSILVEQDAYRLMSKTWQNYELTTPQPRNFLRTDLIPDQLAKMKEEAKQLHSQLRLMDSEVRRFEEMEKKINLFLDEPTFEARELACAAIFHYHVESIRPVGVPPEHLSSFYDNVVATFFRLPDFKTLNVVIEELLTNMLFHQVNRSKVDLKKEFSILENLAARLVTDAMGDWKETQRSMEARKEKVRTLLGSKRLRPTSPSLNEPNSE
ncbi:MAG: hypothetical protein KGJ02_05235 [Verrucomicrobiota bacterium]|nr:hypothetical protein [Verrucomicrobiota bacterium]